MSIRGALIAWTEAIKDKLSTETEGDLHQLSQAYGAFVATPEELDEVGKFFNIEKVNAAIATLRGANKQG